MGKRFYDAIADNPIIAAVKNMDGLEKSCSLEDIRVIFVLFGDICSIQGIVRRIKEAGKIAVVHMDLISGLGTKEIAVDFLKENTMLDGIISTKPSLIKRAKELHLYTILRYFLIDSMALAAVVSQPNTLQPDFIEILPGVMPKIIKQVCSSLKVPIIAGGLIGDKESVMAALAAGATAVSTTTEEVWRM